VVGVDRVTQAEAICKEGCAQQERIVAEGDHRPDPREEIEQHKKQKIP